MTYRPRVAMLLAASLLHGARAAPRLPTSKRYFAAIIPPS
jgi:hypothetical protein